MLTQIVFLMHVATGAAFFFKSCKINYSLKYSNTQMIATLMHMAAGDHVHAYILA